MQPIIFFVSLMLPLPLFSLLLDSYCQVNYVSDNETSPDLYNFGHNSEKFLVTFTTSNVMHLNNVIELEEISITQFTISDRYFRFAGRFQCPCMIFYILTATFETTLEAIRNSGFSTSDHTLYFIKTGKISEDDPLILSFSHLLFMSDIVPFHAGIIFYSETSSSILALHCYFCDNNLTLTYNKSVSHLQQMSADVNSRGYGRTLSSFPFLSLETLKEDCIITADEMHDSLIFYIKLNTCYDYQFVSTTNIFPYANLTFQHMRYTAEIENEMRWFIQLQHFNGLLYITPNDLVSLRGTYVLQDEMPFHGMACVGIASLSSFDYTFREIFCWPVLIAFILVVIPHVWIYESISWALDTAWPLFGFPYLSHRHPRKIAGFTMLSISLFWNAYAATISTNGLRITIFPSIRHLIKLGYTFWASHHFKNVIRLVSNLPNVQEVAGQLYKHLDGTNSLARGISVTCLT